MIEAPINTQKLSKHNAVSRVFVISALLGLTYHQTFIWMRDRWSAPDSYYSHGWLIPVVFAYLVWTLREALAEQTDQTHPLHWLPLIGGVLLHAAGMIFRIYFLSGLSIIPVLMGLSIVYFGVNNARKLAFPISFLIFMIPLPLILIASLSYQLKHIASRGALFLLNAFSIPAIAQGSLIYTPNAQLMVGDVCSGLRSLISLLALGALYSYLSGLSPIRKVILFLAALPISIAVNSIRIFILSLIAEIWGADKATGFIHDLSGIMLFAMALAALHLLMKLLNSTSSSIKSVNP